MFKFLFGEKAVESITFEQRLANDRATAERLMEEIRQGGPMAAFGVARVINRPGKIS